MRRSSLSMEMSGRSRLFANVIAGWLAHSIALVIGFAMPRLIYESVGLTLLGLWDLAWSLVVYLGYSGLGTGSAVTFYVARYRARGQTEQISESIATAGFCQLLLALAVAAVFTGGFAIATQTLPDVRTIADTTIVAIGLLLGLTVLIGLLGDLARGVLTGCHRHGYTEYVSIISDVALAVAMLGVIFFEGGLLGLAAVTLATRSVFEVLRFALARRVCSEMSFSPRHFRIGRIRSIFRYGVKSSTGIFQEFFIHQVARLALAITAGPAALACYSRYWTLIRQIVRTIDRMTGVVPSMVSSLVGMGREEEVERFGSRASKAAMLALLPMIVVFGVFGDDIVAFWMGPEFVIPGLATVLAVTALLNGDRMVAVGILSGLNAHGRIALICLSVSLVVFAFGIWWLTPLDPLKTGTLLLISSGLGISLPHFVLTCRRLGVPALTRLREIYLMPLALNAIFLFFMAWVDDCLRTGRWMTGSIVFLSGCVILIATYWLFAFDDGMRFIVLRRTARMTSGMLAPWRRAGRAKT